MIQVELKQTDNGNAARKQQIEERLNLLLDKDEVNEYYDGDETAWAVGAMTQDEFEDVKAIKSI